MGTSIFYSAPLVRQASVTLTNAQIKTLPTTPVTIVSAPGLNRIIMSPSAYGGGPSVALWFDWTANYTNVDAGAKIVCGLTGGPSTSFVESSFFSWGEDAYFALDPQSVSGSSGYGPVSVSAEANQAMTLSVNNAAAGVFTGGNAANTITVSVAYYLLDTTTGQFV